MLRKPLVFIFLSLIIFTGCQNLFRNTADKGYIDDLALLPEDKRGSHTPYLSGDTTAPYGFYAYVPDGYDEIPWDYPLLIFLHGSGEKGNSTPAGSSAEKRESALNILDKVLKNGPPKLIEQGLWNPAYPMIVASPQSSVWWNSSNLQDFIDFMKKTYRINESRIYLTGLSMGGFGTFNYLTTYGDSGEVAAAVPICGSGSPSKVEVCLNIPVWAFHGEADGTVNMSGSVNFVNAYNSQVPPPTVPAKLTLYPGVGHNSWTRTYDGSGMGDENPAYDNFNISIYDWMLSYRKD